MHLQGWLADPHAACLLRLLICSAYNFLRRPSSLALEKSQPSSLELQKSKHISFPSPIYFIFRLEPLTLPFATIYRGLFPCAFPWSMSPFRVSIQDCCSLVPPHSVPSVLTCCFYVSVSPHHRIVASHASIVTHSHCRYSVAINITVARFDASITSVQRSE